MNFHKDNSIIKRKYTMRWKPMKQNNLEKSAVIDDTEDMKEKLQERESRILKSIGNISKTSTASNQNRELSLGKQVDPYGVILMRIEDKCLSGDENDKDHFTI
jgi:hypothetical protein